MLCFAETALVLVLTFVDSSTTLFLQVRLNTFNFQNNIFSFYINVGCHKCPTDILLSFLVQPLFYPTMVRCRGVTAFDHTQGHTTIGRNPLDEGSARRRDLYLTTPNTHNRQTCMPPAGFEPAIPAGDRMQTLASDRSASGICSYRH